MTKTLPRIRLALCMSLLAAFASAARAQTPPAPPAPTPQPAPPAATKPGPAAETPKLVYVMLSTSKGDIVLELNHEKAPISVDNFLAYVDKKFYDGTIFHRVIGNFMIQGGGFTPDMQQKPTDPTIKNEWQNGLHNERGTIAMGRRGDNKPNPSTVDSANSQFYINVVDNPGLDRPQLDGGAYAVFGKVVAGMSAVDAIKAVPTATKGPHGNVPVEPVLLNQAKRLTPEEAKKAIAADKPAEKPAPPPQ